MKNRISLPPITLRDVVLGQPGVEQRLRHLAAAGRVERRGTAPSKSEPSPTWSAPATPPACTIARAIARASSPHTAVSQIADPRPRRRWRRSRAAARRSRLRRLSQVPLTPVWETTTGRVAIASTSSMVRGDACARSTSTLRLPCADPLPALVREAALLDAVGGAADLGVEEVRRRHHAEARVLHGVDVARSPSSACAPSRPGSRPRAAVGPRRVQERFQVGRVRTTSGLPRAAGAVAEPVGLVQRAVRAGWSRSPAASAGPRPAA